MPARVTDDPTRAAHAIIDTAAAGRNLQRIKSVVPDAKVMAVIKANAYGHGMLRMALGLAEADAFAVARTDEGLALRQCGLTQRISVLQGFVSEDELRIHAVSSLEPVIHSEWQVAILEKVRLSSPIRVWLKIDTGMNRLGILPREFEALLARLNQCESVAQPILLMSHLANADAREDGFTDHQWTLFADVTKNVATERSIANSAGLLAWENTRVDWVRPGISLYGVSPFPDRTGLDEDLEPVMTFRTRLISIKWAEAGTRVGYGGDWVCERPTLLGVAAVGYGDGYPRLAASGAPVLVRNQRALLAGRVSMDMITLDLTGCPDSRVGDPVTLWGHGLPVEEIARCAGTIPYDLLCGITQRVRIIEQ